MFSLALLFVLAIVVVLGSLALSFFLVGISRYLRDDTNHASIDKFGTYSGSKLKDLPLTHCPEYRASAVDFEYAHVSGPWHG